jgi:hypothetical protein
VGRIAELRKLRSGWKRWKNRSVSLASLLESLRKRRELSMEKRPRRRF